MRCLEQYITPDIRRDMEQRFYLTEVGTHERRVLKYALLIYNALATPYCLGRKKRTLLYYSALLHDIGYEVSPQKHDIHTYKIITKDPFFHFWPNPEREMLALVAGGHRKKIGVEINRLAAERQKIVKQLAAILRIADAIDYPRDQSLQMVDIRLENHCLTLFIQSAACATASARVLQKCQLFCDVYDLSLAITEV